MSYNMNSGYGQALLNAVHSAVPTFGRIFVVVSSSDYAGERYQKLQEVFKPYKGLVRFYTSLSTAYDATEDGNHDVIVLDGKTTHTLTAELNVTKSRVHFVGLDYLMGVHRTQGQSSKINIGVTTATGDVTAILNTGVRNSFRGLKITNNNTLTQALYCFGDGGEYTYMEDCEVAYLAKLTTATVADLLCNGDSSHYKNCSFGTTVNEITANGARPNVLVSRETITGKVARDVKFENCEFLYKCGDTDNRWVYGANATDVERKMFFVNCIFFNSLLAAQTMTLGMHFASAQTEGAVIVKDCASYKCTDFATQTGIFQCSGAAQAANGCEVIQSA
jgi:hypothetical protein